MKSKLRLVTLLAVLVLIALPVAGVSAQPPQPQLFLGDVTIGGTPAPVGTTVSGWIEGVVVASMNVTVAGEYALPIVNDNYAGKNVTFTVNGVVGGEGVFIDLAEESPIVRDLVTYTLTVHVVGAGSVDLNPPDGDEVTPGAQYPSVSPVTVTLAPDPDIGYRFSHWSGELSGEATPETLLLDDNKTVTAHFEKLPIVSFEVKDNDGDPIEGAAVSLNSHEATTDPEGKAEFAVVSGTYNYTVSMLCHVTVEGQVEVADEDVAIPITLVPAEYTVTFNVTDVDAGPMEGASVSLNGHQATTNVEGKVEFQVISGTYNYTVSILCHVTVEDQVEVTHENVTVPVTLVPAEYTVTFNVTDMDAQAVGEATVSLNGHEATTDAEGKAEFELVSGNYTYTVSKAGYLTVDGQFEVSHEEVTVEVILEEFIFRCIELQTGWNLISMPVVPEDTDIETVLADIMENVAIVWEYDAGTGEWKWYVPGQVQSTLTTMQDGSGYWVRMNAADTLCVVGQEVLEPPQYPVVEGWNLIGFTSTTAMHHSEYLSDLYTGGAPDYSIIWVWDATTPKYFNIHPLGELDGNLEPGHGYWLRATKDGTIVAP